MPRPPSLIPSSTISLCLRQDLRAKLDLQLWSTLEDRVPKGAYKAFFEARMQEHFAWVKLDLQPFGFPAGFFVSGPKEMIQHLEQHLKGKSE